jgi:hypothetical protein
MKHVALRPRGMVIQTGRTRYRPAGPVLAWPERVPGLADMQAAEIAAQERRMAYRRWEASQPCGVCGQAAPGHAPGCFVA